MLDPHFHSSQSNDDSLGNPPFLSPKQVAIVLGEKQPVKNLQDLLVFERFLVLSATSIVHPHYSSLHPTLDGGRSNDSLAGYSFTTVLNVFCEKNSTNFPLERIIFHGYSPVQGGDYISAGIVKGEATYASVPETIRLPSVNARSFTKREHFLPQECAIEINSYDKDKNKVVRTDRSVFYRKFMGSSSGLDTSTPLDHLL